MNIKNIMLITMVAFLCAVGGLSETKTQLLRRDVFPFVLQADNLPDSISTFANKQHIPIGIEVASEISPFNAVGSVQVSFNGGTLAAALDKVVKTQPGYTWHESDGVIEVNPDKRIDSVLDVVVGKFEVKQVNKYEALAKLTNRAEFKAWLLRTGIKQRSFLGGSTGLSQPHQEGLISLNLSNTTVRSILNEIMKASNSYTWVCFRYGPKGQYLSLRDTLNKR